MLWWLLGIVDWLRWLSILALKLCLRFNCNWAFIGPMTLIFAMEIAKWRFFSSSPLFSSAFLITVFAIVPVFAAGPVFTTRSVFAGKPFFAARSVFTMTSATLVVPAFL